MFSTSQFRKGLKIEIDGVPFVIVDCQFVSPGKGGAFVRTKIRNMINGSVIERTYKSGEKVDKADLEQREYQFLYQEDGHYHFMDQTNYEQIPLDKEMLGKSIDFLKEGIVVQLLFHNEKAIGIDLPNFVELSIKETEPGFKGDTVSGGGNKPAVVETGARVMVPLHINEGDVIKVDTRDTKYVEKVNR